MKRQNTFVLLVFCGSTLAGPVIQWLLNIHYIFVVVVNKQWQEMQVSTSQRLGHKCHATFYLMMMIASFSYDLLSLIWSKVGGNFFPNHINLQTLKILNKVVCTAYHNIYYKKRHNSKCWMLCREIFLLMQHDIFVYICMFSHFACTIFYYEIIT